MMWDPVSSCFLARDVGVWLQHMLLPRFPMFISGPKQWGHSVLNWTSEEDIKPFLLVSLTCLQLHNAAWCNFVFFYLHVFLCSSLCFVATRDSAESLAFRIVAFPHIYPTNKRNDAITRCHLMLQNTGNGSLLLEQSSFSRGTRLERWVNLLRFSNYWNPSISMQSQLTLRHKDGRQSLKPLPWKDSGLISIICHLLFQICSRKKSFN